MPALLAIGTLVGRAVVLGDIRLGVCVDVLLDGPLGRLVGLEVLSPDAARRFLPISAAELSADAIAVSSTLVLVDGELDFYRDAGTAFSQLRGQPVRLRGREVGPLADVLVDREGEVRRIVASARGGAVELEPGAGAVVGNHLLRPAV